MLGGGRQGVAGVQLREVAAERRLQPNGPALVVRLPPELGGGAGSDMHGSDAPAPWRGVQRVDVGHHGRAQVAEEQRGQDHEREELLLA
eukprot:1820745-Lingulodinium_polyedra.AAC.1